MKKESFEEYILSFANGNGRMVNATELAEAFEKEVNDWLVLPYVKSFLEDLTRLDSYEGIDLILEQVNKDDPLKEEVWMHGDIAVIFVQWLSAEFFVFCYDRIKEGLFLGNAETPKLSWRVMSLMLLHADNEIVARGGV